MNAYQNNIAPHFASEDEKIAVEAGAAGADAATVIINGPVTRTDVHRILAFFIDVEPEPDEVCSSEVYDTLMDSYRERIERSNGVLRAYAEQIEHKTLSNMQKVYYSFTNDPRYLGRAFRISVVAAVLNDTWDGVGEWRY
jgi:hypothetical protein